ncbi:MAG: nucleoside-diphosphate sugar epimerase [Methanobacteriales archaeon HGW-Methanobacteriales-1]|jgi:UDP-glucose 4-epimerase|nr:MAG: nucleoside-diphosphate sugar epimerase [Methanobacteriales archaeon HGW-Methanobacteriales-1]
MKLNGKRIIVTGGAGFIGSNLLKHLINEKTEVLVLDNLFTGKKEFIPPEVQFKNIDIRSDEIKEIIKDFKPDNIIHLAAIHYIPYCNENPEETFDVNVMGTRNILEASQGIDFFFASSAAVYPPLDGPLDENIIGPMDVYGKTKLIGEDLVRLYAKNAIIGRFFNAYGPNETNPHLIPEIIDQILCGNNSIELGNLSPKRDYIHVDDICSAIISLLKSNNPGVYNIGTGNEYSVTEIVDAISQILDRNIEIIQDPKRMRKVEREHLLADITTIQKIGWNPKESIYKGLNSLITAQINLYDNI